MVLQIPSLIFRICVMIDVTQICYNSSLGITLGVILGTKNIIHLFLLGTAIILTKYYYAAGLFTLIHQTWLWIAIAFSPPHPEIKATYKVSRLFTNDTIPKKSLENDSQKEFQTWKCLSDGGVTGMMLSRSRSVKVHTVATCRACWIMCVCAGEFFKQGVEKQNSGTCCTLLCRPVPGYLVWPDVRLQPWDSAAGTPVLVGITWAAPVSLLGWSGYWSRGLVVAETGFSYKLTPWPVLECLSTSP